MKVLQRCPPRLNQSLLRLAQGLSLRKYEQSPARKQVRVQSSYQFSKNPFSPIASDRVSKSLSHDNPDTTWGIAQLVCHEIKKSTRNSATMAFYDLDLSVIAQKNSLSPLRPRCHWRGKLLRRIPPVPNSGENFGLVGERTPNARDRRAIRRTTCRSDTISLDRQPSSSLGSPAGQHLPSILGAHTFSKSVLALLFQVGRLLKCERHNLPFVRALKLSVQMNSGL